MALSLLLVRIKVILRLVVLGFLDQEMSWGDTLERVLTGAMQTHSIQFDLFV